MLAIAGIFGADTATPQYPTSNPRTCRSSIPLVAVLRSPNATGYGESEPEYAREGTVIGSYIGTHVHVHRVAVLYQVGINESEVAAIKGRASHFTPR